MATLAGVTALGISEFGFKCTSNSASGDFPPEKPDKTVNFVQRPLNY